MERCADSSGTGWKRLKGLAVSRWGETVAAPLLAAVLAMLVGFLPGRLRASPAEGGTVLGIQGAQFTVNGAPVFLLGFSYYGGLGASEEFVRQDLEDFQRCGFNWLRVWATWEVDGVDLSAVDTEGRAREPFLGRLKWLVAECDRRGMVVDVTLTRGARAAAGRLPDYPAHRQAVETLLQALQPHRNWYLDLANERDVGDARFVGPNELKRLRQQVRDLDPDRLVTASFGGHDLDRNDVEVAVRQVGVDFLAPHRPRAAGTAGQTAKQTQVVLALAAAIGRAAPVHYQEPFRRGYGAWQPVAADFLTDLRGAVVGGAAGWCFHNGSQQGAPDQQPRRSFDLHQRRLSEQLDAQEREVVAKAAEVVRSARAGGKDSSEAPP